MIDREKFPRLAERLRLKVPKEKVAQTHEFVTDLAVGFDEGAWPSDYILHGTIGIKNIWTLDEDDEKFREFINRKWEGEIPYYHSIVTMGYLAFLEGNKYGLTERALRLADEPITPPNVFISYKRSESSAFALLLEARIKYETNATPFLDKSIEPGDDWHPRLEEKVKSCEAFVCVIGPKTLDSPYVRNEIRWAQYKDQDSLIIPVWHNQYAGSHENDTIKSKQAVIVEGENAKNYDSAVNEVLNRLGYSPHFIAQRQNA